MLEYSDYVLEEAHTPEYDAFLICLSHESILNYLDQIQEEPVIENHSGKLLVDQLMVTGNGQNRFLLVSYLEGVLDLSSGECVEPDASYRERAVKSLKDRAHLLGNSILLEEEIEKIKQGEIL